MGRHHHHIKLPEHLYLSPPTPPPTNYLTSSFRSVKSSVYYNSPSALLYDTSASAKAVGDKIPGFKTSAAFLTTLRANLHLEQDDSLPPSVTNTPNSLRPVSSSSTSISAFTMASSVSSLSSISPFAQQPLDSQTSQSSEDPDTSIPSLTTTQATSESDLIDSLRLVADTVAQQRQIAARAILSNYASLAFLTVCFALLHRSFYKGLWTDYVKIGTTFAGIFMTVMAGTRWIVGGYIEEAERVGTWKWLDLGRKESSKGEIEGNRDEVLVTKFGSEIIGVVILRGVRTELQSSVPSSTTTSTSNSRKRTNQNSPPRGLVRAWAVKQRYRKKGVGTALLEDAVKLTQSKNWSGPEFASDHAHSKVLLPKLFNQTFVEYDRLAGLTLDKTKTETRVDGLEMRSPEKSLRTKK